MKIAHLFFLMDYGGVERNILNLCNASIDQGHEIKVIISHRLGHMANLLPPEVELILLPPSGKMVSLIHHLKKVNVCHVHSTNFNPFFIWAASIADVPILVNSVEASIQYPFSAYCDFIVCPSYFVRNLQSRMTQIRVIYNGVASIHHRSNRKKTSKDKIIVAEIRRPNKELFYSLEQLIPHLSIEGAEVEGWILGQEGKSTERIKYKGFVKNPASLLKQADFVVHFSKHEALSNAIIEAMAVGAIPIASLVGGIAEIIEHEKNGFLVPPDRCRNMETLINLLRQLLKDYYQNRQHFEQIRFRGFQKIEKQFTLEKMHQQHMELYHQLWQNTSYPKKRALAPLIESKDEETCKVFLALLEGYSFNPEHGIQQLRGMDLTIFSEKQRAFLLGILAQNAMQKGQYQIAKQLLQYATTLWKEDFYLNLNLGICLKELNKYDEAEAVLIQAHYLMPDEIEPYLLLLELYINQNAFDQIEKWASQLSQKLSSDHPMANHITTLLRQAVPIQQSKLHH
ncbi:MAG: glycosyltransferase [candidate division KSB1 bacterium]|nr:glycosyltransferase [candidate division KSB1 bacterium]